MFVSVLVETNKMLTESAIMCHRCLEIRHLPECSLLPFEGWILLSLATARENVQLYETATVPLGPCERHLNVPSAPSQCRTCGNVGVVIILYHYAHTGLSLYI